MESEDCKYLLSQEVCEEKVRDGKVTGVRGEDGIGDRMRFFTLFCLMT